jgi:hypothetical protein
MLVTLMVENKKKQNDGVALYVCTEFHENWPDGSTFVMAGGTYIRGLTAHTQKHDISRSFI